MSPIRRTRTAVSLPFLSAASSMRWIWPRPWIVACEFSERVSFQRTGTLCLRDSAMHSSSSAYTLSLEPKPPPTAGATTRTWCSGMPSVTAVISLRMCGICVAEYSVMSPPNGCGTATTARASIAIGSSRCCT